MRQITLSELRTMAIAIKSTLIDMAHEANNRDPFVFLHWSAGHYGQPFSDYHINVDQNGELYTDVHSLADRLEHTWHHNTGAVSVALLCCAFASTVSLGGEPPTQAQIDSMAKVIAVLCQELELPCDYDHIRTHAEQADEDGYGPATTCERWDLWFLPDVPRGEGGNLIRGKANWYIQNGVGDHEN